MNHLTKLFKKKRATIHTVYIIPTIHHYTLHIHVRHAICHGEARLIEKGDKNIILLENRIVTRYTLAYRNVYR